MKEQHFFNYPYLVDEDLQHYAESWPDAGSHANQGDVLFEATPDYIDRAFTPCR